MVATPDWCGVEDLPPAGSSPTTTSAPPAAPSGEVGVPQRVAGPVDARPLAEPHAEHAVDVRVGKLVGELRAPDCGGGELLVDAGLEDDAGGLLQVLATPDELLVEAAERRAGVAAGEAAGGVARGPVEAGQGEQDEEERLGAGPGVTASGADRSSHRAGGAHQAQPAAARAQAWGASSPVWVAAPGARTRRRRGSLLARGTLY